MPKVLLGDVARERKETCKGSKAGYPIVGLEHLVPEEITLTTWNEGCENTFSKMFTLSSSYITAHSLPFSSILSNLISRSFLQR